MTAASPRFSPKSCCTACSCRAFSRTRASEPATQCQLRLDPSGLGAPTIIWVFGRSRRTPVRNRGYPRQVL